MLNLYSTMNLEWVDIQFHDSSGGLRDTMDVMGGERDVENLTVVRRSNTQ